MIIFCERKSRVNCASARPMSHFFAASVSALFLSSCALAANVTIPNAPAISSYRAATAGAPEVHVIGVYESWQRRGFSEVRVRYNQSAPMQPITLVLSSYEPNQWRLNIDPSARIEKIVLGGYNAQTVTGAGSIPVINRSGFLQYPDSYAYDWPLNTEGSHPQRMLVGMEELLGTRISSFSGVYSATSITVDGSPLGSPVTHPRLGAGNLIDGQNPDLIYDRVTGEVTLDLADLAAQYPILPGPNGGFQFNRQQLFFALANHDGTFASNNLESQPGGLFSFTGQGFNENRIGADWVSLLNWSGQPLDLGAIFPAGIRDAEKLRSYLAAAHFATHQRRGQFDLIVLVPEPGGLLLVIGGSIFALFGRQRRCCS